MKQSAAWKKLEEPHWNNILEMTNRILQSAECGSILNVNNMAYSIQKSAEEIMSIRTRQNS